MSGCDSRVTKSALLCNTYSFLLIRDAGVLHFQLMETPTDFFVDIVSSDNFLVHALEVRKRGSQYSTAVGPYPTRRKHYSRLISNCFFITHVVFHFLF